MFDRIVQSLFDFIGHDENLLGFAVLLLGAALEYVFPPFPGDMVVLLGGVVVAAQGWHWLPVFVAVTAGAMAGAMLAFSAGLWLARHPQSRVGRLLHRNASVAHGVARVLAGFERHGAGYIAINRFLPGIRGFFFLAAGMTGMRPLRVFAWGTLSAALWNALVLIMGAVLGGNLEAMQRFFQRYTMAAWVLLAVALAWFVARALWRRRQRRRARTAGDEV